MTVSLKPFAILISVVIIIFTGSVVFAGEHWKFKSPVEPEMSPDVNLGKISYNAYCASCHGKTARGTDKGPTFINPIYHPGHHSDGAFYLAAHNGARSHHWSFGNMPSIPEVNDSQLEYIVDYVRAVQKVNGVF